MRIELNDKDARMTMLRAYLPDLRREVFRTDDRELRHALAERRDLCERLLGHLESAAVENRG